MTSSKYRTLSAYIMALKKKYRLSKKNDIELVLKNGKRRTAQSFRLFFYPNKLNFSRFCVIISKKVAKKATTRNRIRRRIIGWIQENGCTNITGYDFIILCQVAVPVLPKKILYEDLKRTFNFFYPAISNNAFSRSQQNKI